MAASIEVCFLGSGTSAGVPMIACHCPVCDSTDPRDKRTRSSITLTHGQTRVLIDTTPELRLQCVANGIDRIDAVVYTHAHADHIMGLDDLRRFNSVLDGPLDVWCDELAFATISRCFGYAFALEKEKGVYRPALVHCEIDGPFDIGALHFTPIPLMHGHLPVLGFRVGPIAYCTDTSLVPETSLQLLEGVEVFIIDGLQHSPHPTHLTIEQAVEVARRVGAKRTLLTHLSHQVSHARDSALLLPGVELAYDGLRFEVPA